MEFDKSRVYTALNADESLIGAKGYFANSIIELKEIEKDRLCTFKNLGELNGERYNGYNFFYLVEPVPEKWYVLQDKVSGLLHMPTKCPLAPDTCKCVCTGSLDECNKYIEEHSKPKYRPFKDCDELIETWRSHFHRTWWENDMPTIWVKSKNGRVTSMITDFNKATTEYTLDTVDFSYSSANMEYLLDNFTFLDGSPCGVEE